MSVTNLNKEIKKQMIDRDLSTSDLAKMLGLSVNTIQARLAGRRAWRIEEIVKLGELGFKFSILTN